MWGLVEAILIADNQHLLGFLFRINNPFDFIIIIAGGSIAQIMSIHVNAKWKCQVS